MNMTRTLEAIIDKNGKVRLLEPLALTEAHRAFLVVLEDEPPRLEETTLLSQPALSADWNRPEEDAAWAHLQPGTSF
jgi:hypothetical protein